MSEDKENRYTVPGLQRGLEILEAFSQENKPLSGAELSRRLNLPRASVFRLLQTLELMGFVERIAQSSQYKLGLAVLRLGFGYLASLEISHLGQPILERLSANTGFSSHLVVRDHTQVVIVAKVLGRNSLFNSLQVGARLPAHATVIGRVLLSDFTSEQLRALFMKETLQAYTEHTPTNISRLAELIAQAKSQGHGISQGGFEMGISTIAAPVRDQSRQVVAALSITVPSQQIEPSNLNPLLDELKRCAFELSSLMGYRDPVHDVSTGFEDRDQHLLSMVE
jgi:DNA-binding IclR family transcriptional regulator